MYSKLATTELLDWFSYVSKYIDISRKGSWTRLQNIALEWTTGERNESTDISSIFHMTVKLFWNPVYFGMKMPYDACNFAMGLIS